MTKSDLEKALLKEHSKRQCEVIVETIQSSEERFAYLFSFFSGDDELLAQRAAWPLTYIIEAHPILLKPYADRIVGLLGRDRHPAIRRNLLRALRFIDLGDDLAGYLVDICVNFSLDHREPRAVRANALELYTKITLMYPALLPETLAVIDEISRSHHPSLRAAIKKARKSLNIK